MKTQTVGNAQLVETIRSRLLAQMERREYMDCRLITQDILGEHEGDDFVMAAAYRGLRNMVRTEINRLAGDDETGEGPQIKLPGFEHVHSYYSVSRENREVGVPVETMNRAEFSAKIALYGKFRDANGAHMEELARLRDEIHGRQA